jgi:hypothetical protein
MVQKELGKSILRLLAQVTSGENLYIGTKGVQKLLIVGDSAVRLPITLRARKIHRE